MLRLVEAPKEGQEKRTPRTINPRLSLTSAERARLRAAVRNLARAHGSYAQLAEVVGAPIHSLHHVGSTGKVSYGYALLIARALGMSVDQLIGPLSSTETCPTCGARKGAK